MHGDYQLINIDSSMVSLNFQLKSRSPRVKSKSEISHRLAVGKCRGLNEYLSALNVPCNLL